MHTLTLFSLFAFLMLMVIGAQDIKGWRVPTQKELGNYFSWRKEDANLYLIVKADFDGDHKEDIASLLINEKENKIGLFVKHGNLKFIDNKLSMFET